MNMRESTNPAIRVINSQAGSFNFGGEGVDANAATVSGTATKSLLLVALTLISGWFAMAYSINSVVNTGTPASGLMYASLIAGVIVAFITIFKPHTAPVTAPIYALCEGAALGSLSGMFEFKYPGIVSTAVMSTFVVVMVMLALWKFRIIVPTQRFRAVVTSATLGVCVLYFVNMLFNLFGTALLPTSGALSVGISLIVCTIAAMNLVLDFDQIEQSVNMGLPKYFEYFNAFSVLVTICWLYIEILRLLANRNE